MYTVNMPGAQRETTHCLFFLCSDAPLEDGGGKVVSSSNFVSQCANAPRTFLNSATCRIGNENACTNTITTASGSISLGSLSIVDLYKKTGRYVYVIKNLRVDDGDVKGSLPCEKAATSRWVPMSEGTACPAPVGPNTTLAFTDLILSSTDRNLIMKDIYFPGGAVACDVADQVKKQLYLFINGRCWKNIHPDENNVYDFTYWTQSSNDGKDNHPGGSSKIKQFAERNSEALIFPSWHGMDRWHSNMGNFPFIGRLGDEVAIDSLPEYFDQISVIGNNGNGAGTLICGSPGT